MKELLAVVAVALSILVIYTVHQDRARKAAADAEAAAQARFGAPKRKLPVKGPTAVAISRVLEPSLLDLFSPLDQQHPADLVPPLQITKERLLDKRLHVEGAKQSVYDHAIRTLDLMIAAAEERTNTLDAVLRIAARPPAALDARNTGTSSNTFFLQTTVKRWEAGKTQRKAAIDQSIAQLRIAERGWNTVVGASARVEDYDVSDLPPIFVKADQSELAGSPLERGAYDQRRQTWRRSYYDQYNQGSTYRY